MPVPSSQAKCLMACAFLISSLFMPAHHKLYTTVVVCQDRRQPSNPHIGHVWLCMCFCDTFCRRKEYVDRLIWPCVVLFLCPLWNQIGQETSGGVNTCFSKRLRGMPGALLLKLPHATA